MRRTLWTTLLFLLVSVFPTYAANPPQPLNLNAFHRSGQTFITWTERSDRIGEQYRVYRHTEAITAGNLSQAVRLRQVAEGSGRFFADRFMDYDLGAWRARYFDRFVIRNLGGPLAAGVGLLAWTLAPEDFAAGGEGRAHYAVTTVNRDGVENIVDFNSENTFGPVFERVSDPVPVKIKKGDHGRGHVYTQFMDLRNWNPTFHAPNETNGYYGLNPADPAVADSIQYAYTYTVGEPDPANCPSGMPARFPLILYLHGWEENAYKPDAADSQYYCAYEIRPIDVSQTWWFGFAHNHDYRRNSWVGKGDTIVNFTESRVMRMVYDLLRDPAFGSKIDPNRVYVYGHSMGGSGTLALALRYPEVFAACYASEPMTDYRNSAMWLSDVRPKWGSPSFNLPIRNIGPGTWADRLTRFDGTGVWDWQDHQANSRNRSGDEFAPFGVAHGRADEFIDWPTQGKPAYAAFDAGRHTWGGAITDDDHTWLSFQGLPPNLAADASLVPFAGLKAVLNETVPGLSKAGGNLPLPPPDPPGPIGGYNQIIQWSSRWKPWDGAPIDTAKSWQMSFRTTDGSSRTVDVTPRRTQYFRVIAGRPYTWENRRVSDNTRIADGVVTARVNGTLTVPDIQVGPEGNRLRITPLRVWPNTTRGVHVFNDQLSGGMSDEQVQFAATHYAGTQKMIRDDADRLRAVNPGFMILHYRLGLGLGYRTTENGCEPTGDWIRIIKGNQWIREWPGEAAVDEQWFFHRPAGSETRVLNCDWGWYLVEPNNAAFRSYWHQQALAQVKANDDDGVFMDSVSVPNYLGGDRFDPNLPDVDPSFESAWATRIKNWLAWLQTQTLAGYQLVVNVGSWITSRDSTDYSSADGLMVEGFAIEADASPYNFSDWRLQMNRSAKAVRRGQAVIAQSYATGGRERMFTLGSYLLIKGNKTFLNIELGEEPEWWPEYDIPIGSPTQGPPANIDAFDPDGNSVYRRNFDNGFVLVNPTSPWDGSGVTRTIAFGRAYYLAVTSGGGVVPGSGIPSGSVSYKAVSKVTLRPYSAAVLFNSRP